MYNVTFSNGNSFECEFVYYSPDGTIWYKESYDNGNMLVQTEGIVSVTKTGRIEMYKKDELSILERIIQGRKK